MKRDSRGELFKQPITSLKHTHAHMHTPVPPLPLMSVLTDRSVVSAGQSQLKSRGDVLAPVRSDKQRRREKGEKEKERGGKGGNQGSLGNLREQRGFWEL